MLAALACLILFAGALAGQPPAAAEDHAQKGLQYAQAGDLARAEAELRRAVELAPHDSSYLTSLGGILGMQHKLAEANVYFEKAVKENPQDATALRNLAANEWQLQRLPEARSHLQLLLRMQPQDHTATLLLGMVSENQHDYIRAAKLLAAVPELVAQRPESVAALASAYYHTSRRQEARRTLETLLGRPSVQQGTFAAAGVAANAQDYLTAEKLLMEAIRAGHATGEMYSLLGWCYEKQNNLTAAAGALQDALRVQPAREGNYLDLAALWLRQRKFTPALDLARRAANRFPQSAGIYRIKGDIETKTSQFTDAVTSYRRAIELEPQSLDAQLGLAAAQWSAGMRTEADAAFQNLVARHADQAVVYERYGTLLLESAPDAETETRAATLLRKAVALDNSCVEAHYHLGIYEMRPGVASPEALHSAREHLEQAAHQRPDDGKIHYALARLYRRMALTDQASKEMQLYQKLVSAEER